MIQFQWFIKSNSRLMGIQPKKAKSHDSAIHDSWNGLNTTRNIGSQWRRRVASGNWSDHRIGDCRRFSAGSSSTDLISSCHSRNWRAATTFQWTSPAWTGSSLRSTQHERWGAKLSAVFIDWMRHVMYSDVYWVCNCDAEMFCTPLSRNFWPKNFTHPCTFTGLLRPSTWRQISLNLVIQTLSWSSAVMMSVFNAAAWEQKQREIRA